MSTTPSTCPKCGTVLKENDRFCPSCGAPIGQSAQPPQADGGFAAKAADLNHTPDTTAAFDPDDIAKNKGLAALSYLTVLVLVPLLAAKDSKYARFHANQGLVLLLVEVAYFIVCVILNLIKSFVPLLNIPFSIVTTLLEIALCVLIILGIVNAVQGKAKELPVIGGIRLLG